MIRGIHHISLHVRDLEGMARFYCDAFGFTDTGFAGGWSESPEIDEIVGLRGSAAESRMLIAGNCYLELFRYTSPAPDDAAPAKNPYEHGFTHFCVDVTDIDAEVARLAALGMNFERPYGRGRPVDVGIVKAIYGRDPEGNLIEVQETGPGCDFGASRLPKASLAQ